jgi:hypothetical protein
MTSPSGGEQAPETGGAAGGAAATEERIRILRKTASRGPLSLALFLVISIAALRFSPSLVLTPAAAKALGPAPSPALISTLLVFYAFFAILLILGRMTQGTGGCTAPSHVAFLTGFYVFYHLAGALQDNFYPVLVAGLSVIGLETWHAWSFAREKIAEETENLKRSRRLREWSAAAVPSPSGDDPPPGEKR